MTYNPEPTHQPPPEAHFNNGPPPPAYSEHAQHRQPDNRPSDYVHTWFGRRRGSPLRNAYSYFASYGWTRWVVDLVTVILSAVILTKDPSRDLFIAAVYTIAAFGISLPLFAPRIKPRSPTDPRPAAWVAYALALTRALVIPSIGLMAYNYSMEPGRRNYRRSFDEISTSHSKRYVYNASGSVEYRLALVCAACGIASVLGGIRQLVFIWMFYKRHFDPEDIRSTFEYYNKKANKENEGSQNSAVNPDVIR